jgi:hypothetical protein
MRACSLHFASIYALQKKSEVAKAFALGVTSNLIYSFLIFYCHCYCFCCVIAIRIMKYNYFSCKINLLRFLIIMSFMNESIDSKRIFEQMRFFI